MNWSDVPCAIVGLVGVTEIEMSVGAVTNKVVELLMPPNVAVIVVLPKPVVVASPLLDAVLLIVAAAVFEEVQVAEAVKNWVLPSL